MSHPDPPLADQRIGFIGLGNMGLPMARHLRAAGAELVVWNRSPRPLEQAEALGMMRADSLPELARAVGGGIICLSLTTTDVVERVVFGEEGLAPGLHAKALLIDFGTTSVTATRRFAALTAWVDAPVSGGQVGAEAGSLTILAGGADAHFQRALPVLHTVGGLVTHLGPAGAGQVAKLANQIIVAQTIDAVAQALRLAELAGLDAARVREALLGGFAESRILRMHGARMLRRDFAPGGRSSYQLKDIRLACELAESLGFHSPTLDNCLRQWESFVQQHHGGELDHSALFQIYEPVR